MSLVKDKYREETNEDCYCEEWQVKGGSFNDKYVLWLEQQIVIALNLPVVTQRSELLLFAEYSECDKTSETTDECVDNYLAQKR